MARYRSLLDRWLWQYRRPLFYEVSVVERTPGAGHIPSRWVWLVVFDKIREARRRRAELRVAIDVR